MVYILHFGKKLHRAGYYVGYTKDTERRLKEHLNQYKNGSPSTIELLNKYNPDGKLLKDILEKNSYFSFDSAAKLIIQKCTICGALDKTKLTSSNF